MTQYRLVFSAGGKRIGQPTPWTRAPRMLRRWANRMKRRYGRGSITTVREVRR